MVTVRNDGRDATPRRSSVADVPRTLAISSGAWRPGDDPDVFVRVVRQLAADGVEALQVREKHLDDRELLSLVERVVEAAGHLLVVLVNGRADVARAAAAAGVHLPAAGLPSGAIRERFPELLVGRSTHGLREIEAARADGAHYVTFGPVCATPSKARYGQPQGFDALAAAVRTAGDLPVLALGGLGADDVTSVAEAGCRGVAGIRVFADSDARRRLVTRARTSWPEDRPVDGSSVPAGPSS